ncbi:Gfo/Idh/MocA family protein [Tundrisphaera sp. TA3]|uniref:Gfo/Idh/MocA family protein n=1 Tax=Tundrisphaera sp. TA3 TaxID=3435775 RepID=UPI003EBDC130
MQTPNANRRTFLFQSAATVAAVASSANIAANAYAGGSDTLKIGLVGCGGRGTGAAEQALTADPGNRLVAMGDAFPDQIESSFSTLKGSAVAERVDVPSDARFSGFDAYKNVIDAVDVVLLATPPGFRPIHFAYAVAKGKHAFIEKPMAVDGPGLRMFLDAAKESKAKGLAATHGFCWRYYEPRRELMKRVADGAIGDITSVETTYNSRGVWDPRRTREQCSNDMEYQMRNWYYYSWLSGDHIVEQAVHGIDTMAWALGDAPPTKCWGVGGRQVRTDAKYGNIWDHFSIVYEYPNDVRGYHQCRHWAETASQTADFIQGTKGRAEVFNKRITGANKWRYESAGKPLDMYQSEHNEMFAAIRAGRPINNAEQGAYSTLLALMGRMAAYTGEVITWDKAMNSQEALVPKEFAWGDAPHAAIPIPGIHKFA